MQRSLILSSAGLLVCLLALARSVSAATLWATWELELGDHAPPQSFLLSVTSPTGTPVPPPMSLPWAQCTSVPQAQHCAPIGCPPVGTYDFTVQAQYAEALSAPSNTWRCTIVAQQCACAQAAPPAAHSPPLGRGPDTTRPAPPQAPAPVPQPPPGLVLLPVGEIPALPTVPAIPASAST